MAGSQTLGAQSCCTVGISGASRIISATVRTTFAQFLAGLDDAVQQQWYTFLLPRGPINQALRDETGVLFAQNQAGRCINRDLFIDTRRMDDAFTPPICRIDDDEVEEESDGGTSHRGWVRWSARHRHGAATCLRQVDDTTGPRPQVLIQGRRAVARGAPSAPCQRLARGSPRWPRGL